MNILLFLKNKLRDLFYPPQRFFRYLICGCGAACINYSSFLIFCSICKLHFSISMFLAVTVTWIYSFFANKFFVFQSKKSKNMREAVLFVAQQGILFAVSVGLMWIFVSLLKIHESVSWIIVSGIILLFNFAGMSFFIWKKK